MAAQDPLARPSFYHSQSSSGNRYQQHHGNDHWSNFSSVKVQIFNLPEGVTTLEIYNNFKRFGNVSKIIIPDRRQGDRGTKADIWFEPPPRYPVWERGRVGFASSNGANRHVTLKLQSQQPTSYQVESPVREGVKYNEKTELIASSLSWGHMIAPEKMMLMVTTEQPDENVRLILNLHKREIEIHFPYVFRSDNSVATRTFRFMIALDEDFTIWKLSGHRYVLDLQNIPWYSKQLKEAIALTHTHDAKRWSEEDTWARQTDIFEHKNTYDDINKTPISLHKNLNSINIARWTTFQVRLIDTQQNHVAEALFRNALRDFNVLIHPGSNFEVVEGSSQLDTQIWDMLNGRRESDRPLSLAEELSEIHLPFSVRYQLEVCLSHGWLNEYQITKEFLQALANTEESKAKQMLVYVDSYQQRVWEPMQLFEDLRYRRPVKTRPLPEHCVEVCSATVTAAGLIWNTPTVEITNRIIRKHRHHADRFLRVRFEDDMYRGQSRLYASSNNKMINIFRRIKRVMSHGIKLGDRHYEFLAWGNSQLRERGTYFFAGVDNVTPSKIRNDMGAFDHEKVVAKRAARMGQCFSTTKPVHLRLPQITSVDLIPDIKNGKYIFTDGVGKISRLAAKIVQNQLKIKGEDPPSAFQFRLGGCKGVLTIWPEVENKVLVQLRKSQFKFDSSSLDLEIIRCSLFQQPDLNRQIIICLSHLGVPDEVFLKKQDQTIKALDAAMKDDNAAVKALRDNVDANNMTMNMVDLVNAGFRLSREPFVSSIMHLWKAWSLKYLKEKAKIPVTKGGFLLGCVDETNILRGHFDSLIPHPDADMAEKIRTLPEIFVQVTDPHSNQRKIIEGICVLARNPSLHQGDMRVVKAVNVPDLRHLCDVVVMPANGDRDLPSMCSGGDLDGDEYIVIWDQDLIPKTWNAEPFHYDAPPPRMAVGEITTEDIIDFFYDYLQNDYLGRIAHAHMAAADDKEDGIENKDCLELVQLHSMAVDYPKTGVPAIMERRLERTAWPHFMEKKMGGKYKSHKILGKLYDAVERISFNPVFDSPFDKRILNFQEPTQSMLQSLELLKQDYDNGLQRIMAQHNIRTEFEVWSTFVLDHSKASADFKFHEEIGNLSSSLKDQYYQALCELAGGKDFEHLAPVAVAAYKMTNAMVQTALKEIDQDLRIPGPDGMPFISFPWVLKDTLCVLARNADSSIIDPGSAAIIQDGNVVDLDNVTEFDEQGRAQIRVRDPLDVHFSRPTDFSGHLPDPYQPPSMEDPTEGGDAVVQAALGGSNKDDGDRYPSELTNMKSDDKGQNGSSSSTLISQRSSDQISNAGAEHDIDMAQPLEQDHIPNSSLSPSMQYHYDASTGADQSSTQTSMLAGVMNCSGGPSSAINGILEPVHQEQKTPPVRNNHAASNGTPIALSQSQVIEEKHEDGHDSPVILGDPMAMTDEQIRALGLDDDFDI